MMNLIEKYMQERDKSGNATTLSILLSLAMTSLQDRGCECKDDSGGCLPCTCEAVIVELLTRLESK